VFFHEGKRWCAVGLLALLAIIGGSPLFGVAQTELSRKVKTKVPPTYPELARKMNIRGTVKVLVVVSPNGAVKDSRVVGGNPILVNSAMDAVKQWKFEPAADETTGVIEFRFDNGR
jgi:TonB family protein